MLIQNAKNNKSERWFEYGFGRLVALTEQRLCDRMARDAFGFYGLQLGMSSRFLMRRSPILNCARIGFGDDCDIIADWKTLPLADETADYVLLAHALDAADDARAVLREAVRVLRPEGRLYIIGFNPFSLLSIFSGSGHLPWRSQWLSLVRLNDWLALLDITTEQGVFAVFLPPLAESRHRRRFALLEKAGRRWWPMAGGVYCILGIKHRPGMNVVTPKFKKKVLASRISAVEAKRVSLESRVKTQ